MLNGLASNGASNTICSGIAAPVSLTGRVINATIWEEELWRLIQKEKIVDVGAFVRLRNINNARLPSGINCEILFERMFDHSMKSLDPKIDDYFLSALFYPRLVGPCQIIFDTVAFRRIRSTVDAQRPRYSHQARNPYQSIQRHSSWELA